MDVYVQKIIGFYSSPVSWKMAVLLLSGILLLCANAPVFADEHSHHYEDNEQVVLWLNTVGPYHNRQETYAYFSLPFCRGPEKEIHHHHESMGEALQGFELEFSGLDVHFKENKEKSQYCSVFLLENIYKPFVYAVKNNYWYQMYVDDLPVWGIVGDLEEEGGERKYYIWTHKKFDIGYNGDQIVDVNLTSDGKTLLEPKVSIEFTYEVNWVPSVVEFKDRFEKYLDPNFFQHRIHWFSIFNSFMMVIFLVGLVSMIMMRTLRRDYARYSKESDVDDFERDLGDEYGWKQVHGEVFRSPQIPILFTSLVGTGAQLSFVALCCILLAIFEHVYEQRGTLMSIMVFVYAGTASVNGYIGGALYSQFGGRSWIKQMLTSGLLLPILIGTTVFLINLIAIYYHASRAIPLGTIVSIIAICCFVILPLQLVGTILGRNISGQTTYPCRINTVPRPIPEKKWFMEPSIIILLGGVLPFGSIFIEVYFIFTSFWAYKIYYVYGFMLLVFLILVVVTVCVTIVCTYFLLNAEDYRWHWTSFLSSASICIYVYLYSFYYFFFKTKMYGFFQTMFYFGYMGLFSISLGLLCGTLGFFGAYYFVRKIFATIKVD